MISNWFRRRTETLATAPVPAKALATPRSRREDILHVVALSNFALAQPIYDRLLERHVFLMDLQVGLPAVYALVAVLSFGIPAAIVLLEQLVLRFNRKAYAIVHLAIMAILLVLVALPIIKLATFISGYVICYVSLIVTGCGIWFYTKSHSVRQLIALSAVGAVAFPMVFLISVTSRLTVSSPKSSRSEKFKPAPVVLLVLDEFCGSSLMTPQREIDARRFPNFAALARHSSWFRNATSVNDLTEQAVPAILSGRYPVGLQFPTPADRPQNIFSVLQTTGGYDIAAFEPVSRLAPLRKETFPDRSSGIWKRTTYLADTLARVYLFHIVPDDFNRRLPEIPRSWFGLSDGATVDTSKLRGVFRYEWGKRRDLQFEHFLRCIDGSPHPTLHFMHILFPHIPWCYLPDGRRYSPDGADWNLLNLTTHGHDGMMWGQDELEVIQSQQRYVLQLMYVDHMIGQLVARLKETGQYDDCLLIVTADHGVSYRSNLQRRVFVRGNEDEILSIPLFVKRPRQVNGEISDRAVESIDILPTIADVVGITLNDQPDGWSVFDTSHPERRQTTFTQKYTTSKVSPELIVNSKVPFEMRARFGDSSDPASVFRIGPLPELCGRRIDSLPVSTTSPVELDVLHYGEDVDAAAEIQFPCWYEGSIRTHLPLTDAPVVLAVAINGTIQAVTRTYQQIGFLDQWSAMVPDSAFHDGHNDVQFYTVTGTGPDWKLTKCLVHRPRK